MMSDIQKRFALFIVGCIGTRTLFVIIAKYINIVYLPILGYLALIIAIGFTYIYLTGSRKTGPEVFGDKIWWNDLRPVHAILYGLFAFSAIFRYRGAWIILLADVIVGLVGFLVYHYNQGDFKKVFK